MSVADQSTYVDIGVMPGVVLTLYSVVAVLSNPVLQSFFIY